jgi:hypothetical protein
MTNPTDPTSPENHESAAQYRVSAQELSHIVNIIQARKDAEAKQRANTVALGDAVDQLGLEMTPDELLAEIKADRARRAGVARPRRQNSTQRRTFATFAICAGLAGMMVGSIRMHRVNREIWQSRNNPLYLPHEFASDFAAPLPSMPAMEETTPAQIMPTAEMPRPAQYRAFDQFGEGEPADSDLQALSALANGRSPSDVLVQNVGTVEDRLWRIFKRSGDVLVYAFATPDAVMGALNGFPAEVYASPHEGLQGQLLPLRLFQHAEPTNVPGRSGAILNATSPAEQKVSNGMRITISESDIESPVVRFRVRR